MRRPRLYVNVYAVGRDGVATDPIASVPVELTSGEWDALLDRGIGVGELLRDGRIASRPEWDARVEEAIASKAGILRDQWAEMYPDCDVIVEQHYARVP